MNIFTIVSPDKLSMSMFCNFLKSTYSDNILIIDFNVLNSSIINGDKVEALIRQYDSSNRNIVIKFKLRAKTSTKNIDDVCNKILPLNLVKYSNCIVLFDLYSQQPIVVKDRDNSMPSMIEWWKKSLEVLG